MIHYFSDKPPLHLPSKSLQFSPFSRINELSRINIDKSTAIGSALISLSFICFSGGIYVLRNKLK